MPDISLVAIGSLVGGLGLFMLGMQLMTEGLKLAAGSTLRRILERSTSTPLRGVLSGAFITSFVQSSSAVTVATIGFVNAGLMTLAQAITVIYGSNIGTTMTGWLVAFIGLQINIKVFALPAIGFGMLIRLMKGGRRAGALGEALAGFGIFFIGIDILKDGFTGLSQGFAFSSLATTGLAGLLIYLLLGFLLTLATQSSSAAITIALTAAVSNLISLNTAAAVVIGANIGTTSTAALAVIGATPNAKRVASAHVLFNLLTGIVAALILPFMLRFILFLRAGLDLGNEPAKVLALFHTVFNILGVLLMWPMTRGLVRFLKQRFRTVEEDEARPKYLDANIVTTPVLAINALSRELCRTGIIARRMAKGAISSETGPSRHLEADRHIILRLETQIGDFINVVRRSPLPAELDEVLPNALRVSGYYTEVAEVAIRVAKLQAETRPVENRDLAGAINSFKHGAIKLFDMADAEREEYEATEIIEQKGTLEEEYRELKSHLLKAGTRGHLPVTQMALQLEIMSDIRRLIDQMEKGARYIVSLTAPVQQKNFKTEKDNTQRDAT